MQTTGSQLRGGPFYSSAAIDYAIVLLLAAFFFSGCTDATPPPTPPPPTVNVGKPVVAPIVEWDEYVGRLEAIEFVEVRARVSGYLESTYFDEGLIVEKGALLCVIDPKPFEAEVARAEADLAEALARVNVAEAVIAQADAELRAADSRLELARRQSERAQRLVTQNAVSQDEADIRESEFLQAQANTQAAKARIASVKASEVSALAARDTAAANVAIAKLNLSYTRVYAPVTGRISRRDVTDGNLISGGTANSTLLTTIVSLDPIHAYFDADEQSFLKYRKLALEGKRESSRDVKNPVFIALGDEKNGFPHQGHMDFVDNRLDLETGTIRGRAVIPNPDLSLAPGLFCRARLPGSARYEAVLIPDRAIGTDQSVKYVFLVGDGNKIERKEIILGPISKGLRIIRQGLSGDELVVLDGVQFIGPGSVVTPQEKTIELVDDGLPVDYRPVPESEWLLPRRSKMTAKEEADHAAVVPKSEPPAAPTKDPTMVPVEPPAQAPDSTLLEPEVPAASAPPANAADAPTAEVPQ